VTPEYPYGSGDPIANRNTYFFTPFGGIPFLRGWVSSRATLAAALDESKEQAAPAAPKPVMNEERVATRDLLDWLAAAVRRGELDEQACYRLEIMLKKFEVGKRLFERYDATPPHRPAAGAGDRQLELYVRYAELMELCHARLGGLRYLNVLLKVMDTVSAYFAAMAADLRPRAARIAAREHAHVMHLANALGVGL
jgi:hypothetical protein